MKQDTIASKKAILEITDIKETVKEAVLSCYGISFIGRYKQGNNKPVSNTTKKGNKEEEGIYITRKLNNTFNVDVYVNFATLIKITEALISCKDTITYNLNKKYEDCKFIVNVYAESISLQK